VQSSDSVHFDSLYATSKKILCDFKRLSVLRCCNFPLLGNVWQLQKVSILLVEPSVTVVMNGHFVCYHSDKEAIDNLKSLMTLPQKVVNELGVATW